MRWFIVLFLALGVWIQPSPSQSTEPLSLQWTAACNNEASVVRVIEASRTKKQGKVFAEEQGLGRCKLFPEYRPLGLHFTRVVRDNLTWGDGETMFVIEGRDNKGVQVFIWMTKSTAEGFGIDGLTSQPI